MWICFVGGLSLPKPLSSNQARNTTKQSVLFFSVLMLLSATQPKQPPAIKNKKTNPKNKKKTKEENLPKNKKTYVDHKVKPEKVTFFIYIPVLPKYVNHKLPFWVKNASFCRMEGYADDKFKPSWGPSFFSVFFVFAFWMV